MGDTCDVADDMQLCSLASEGNIAGVPWLLGMHAHI